LEKITVDRRRFFLDLRIRSNNRQAHQRSAAGIWGNGQKRRGRWGPPHNVRNAPKNIAFAVVGKRIKMSTDNLTPTKY